MKPTPLSTPGSAIAKKEENLHIDISSYSDGTQEGEQVPTKRNWAGYLPVVSLITCVIAIFMDPLFFFIPVINDKEPCIKIAETVMNTALTSRAFTDITFLVHIIHQIRGAVVASNFKSTVHVDGSSRSFGWLRCSKAIAKELWCRKFITDILAILPVPQVVIVYLFLFRARKSRTRITLSTMVLNFMLLVQYLPRMYRIFLSSRKLRKNSKLLFKGAFYFSMYILASYVLGSFYYYNTVQRKVTCWQQTSEDEFWYGTSDCWKYFDYLPSEVPVPVNCSTLYYYTCDGPRNTDEGAINLLEGACDGSFDYGIFKDGLSSAYKVIVEEFTFEKILYFIWWGLKNLSNFGTGLETASSAWESCFAIIICTVGLILFAYLIGNMQECMQSAEEKKAVSDKVRKKQQDLLEWMDANHLSDDKLRKEIITEIKQKLDDEKDADLDNLFSPLNVKSLKPILCMDLLKKVPGLQTMDARGLKMICHFLKPVIYSEETIIFGVGQPLDRMLFIAEGIVLIYSTGSDNTHQDGGKEITVRSPPMIHGSLEKGDVYGDEQLLSWASSTDVPVYTALPISTKTVRCHTKVECFVLIAKDLKTVVSSYKQQLHLKHRSSSNENMCSTDGSGGTSMIRRTPTARD